MNENKYLIIYEEKGIFKKIAFQGDTEKNSKEEIIERINTYNMENKEAGRFATLINDSGFYTGKMIKEICSFFLQGELCRMKK